MKPVFEGARERNYDRLGIATLTEDVVDAMMPHVRENVSINGTGEACRAAKDLVEKARMRFLQMAGLVGGQARFFRSMAEIRSLVGSYGALAAATEPPFNGEGPEVSVDGNGLVRWKTIEEDIEVFSRDEGFGVVSVPAVVADTGVLQPMSELAEGCAANGIGILCDVTMLLGVGPAPDVGFLAAEAFGIGGPRGVAVLWVPDQRIADWDVEERLTDPRWAAWYCEDPLVSAVAGFLKAMETVTPFSSPDPRDAFERAMEETGTVSEFHGRELPRLPNVSSFVVDCEAATIVEWLEKQHGIAVGVVGGRARGLVNVHGFLKGSVRRSTLRVCFGPDHGQNEAEDLAAVISVAIGQVIEMEV